MIFDHLRYGPRVSLLAFGALEGREREATERHAGSCARCRSELEALLALREELRADPVRAAEPGLPLPMLVARVEARVSEALARPRAAAWAWRLGVGLTAAAAIVAIALLAPRVLPRFAPAPAPPVALGEAPVVSAEALARLERNVAREQAARYLSDAGDVLVTVAATPAECDRKDERVDVGQASARSRELLARRALLLESGPQVASARPVLDDVEQALREVASLQSCVRRKDVERLRENVERRQLLLRIRLMTRELEG